LSFCLFVYLKINSCYPYTETDPLIIEETPDVYFMGDSKEFTTRLLKDEKNNQEVRIVTIPAFYKTQSFVLVNLKNLDCFEISLENALVH
jgi:DNA polymerase delta subunit 2